MIWEILVAAIVGYVIGALWYSPMLFGKSWMKFMKFKRKDIEKAKEKGMIGAYIATFIGNVVMAYVLFMVVDAMGAVNWIDGAIVGFWLWLGFLATTMLGIVFWQGKPWGLYLLNSIQYLVSLMVMGGILGAWY